MKKLGWWVVFLWHELVAGHDWRGERTWAQGVGRVLVLRCDCGDEKVIALDSGGLS